jgi:hypothetical protein
MSNVTSTTPQEQTKNTGSPDMSNGSSRQKLRIPPKILAAIIITVGAIVVALVYTIPLYMYPSSGRAGYPLSSTTSPTTLAPTPAPTLTPTPSPPNVLITDPMDQGQVTMQTPVQGTSQNIPQDEQLWLFIEPSNQTTYFPQANDPKYPSPIKIVSGKWVINASFGGPGDVGLEFTLIPVLINQHDQEAHSVITKYFQQKGPVYIGIQQTSGMQLLFPSEITVVRI